MSKHLQSLLYFILIAPQIAQSAPKCHNVFNLVSVVSMPSPVEQVLRRSLLFDVTQFPEHTSARVFVEIAQRNMLLNQNDGVLDSKGLLVPNGGLCASTCLTNLLGAMTAQEGNFREFLRNAPEITELVVRAYSEHTGVDARLGADVRVLAEISATLLPEVIQKTQYDSMFSHLDISVGRYQRELYPHLLVQKLKGDTMAIVSVRPINPQEAGTELGHAIIILKVDSVKKTILLSDPNKPNEIIETPYYFTKGTDIAFRVPLTYGDHLVHIFQINTFTRIIHFY